MKVEDEKSRWLSGGLAIVILIALAKVIFHTVFNDRYGFFRDEFDYLACGEHLAWGFVDQPPLLPFLAKMSRMVLGDSLRAVRFMPAVVSACSLVVTGLIARELGGRRFALILAAVAFLIAPAYLSGGSLLTTNSLEPLLWGLCIYFAVLAIKRDPRYWVLFGVVAGLGLEEKYSIAVLGFGIVIGLVLSGRFRTLIDKWFIAGGVAAFIIFLPNLIWNIQNDWPFVQLMQNLRATGRDVQLSTLQFFLQQILLIHPLTAPIWLAGLIALLVAKRFKAYRMLGWCYLAAFTTFTLLNGKNYYLAPIYPMLLAAGAVACEAGLERIRLGRWLKPLIVAILLAAGAWFVPVVVPVLPVDAFLVYLDKLPFDVPRSEHGFERARLPQHYADQFGWEELTSMTAVAWNRLDESERADCAIFGQNYGQAGAIDFFGPRYGLPPAISGHQTYYLWGPRGHSGNCMIVIDDKKERLDELFESVEYVGSSDNPYALERNVPVYICRGAKFGSLAELWPRLKKWR